MGGVDLSWVDEVAGTLRAEPEQFGDVVLARKDIGTSYHLAVTVDDAVQGVNFICRGMDLFAATMSIVSCNSSSIYRCPSITITLF